MHDNISTSPTTVWIFDVDGVLTHPEEKTIPGSLLDFLINKLKLTEPVVLNTGRNITWLDKKLLNALEEKITEKKLLQNFFVVAEKGAVWLKYAHDGRREVSLDSSVSVPRQLQTKVKELIEEQFSSTMFYDPKQTMISVEMKQGVNIDKYHQEQKFLVEEMQNLLKEPQYIGLRIDPTIIATDVENKRAGKDLGVQRIIDWLEKKNNNVKHFYTFGDSEADIKMAEKLYDTFSKTAGITFIFTGNTPHWEQNHLPFTLIHSPGFSQGTLDFLSTINK